MFFAPRRSMPRARGCSCTRGEDRSAGSMQRSAGVQMNSALRSAGGKDCSSRGIQGSDHGEMTERNFLAELKRRNVYKVAVAYLVGAWLLIQAASILFPTFDAPAWSMKVVVVFLALGFPAALIFSWA